MNGDDEEAVEPVPPPEAWGASARMQAIGDIDADPDDAGRALHLSKITGVPAPVIHADTENFERNQKQFLAAGIIDRNPFLQAYVNTNPMASKVSNDDYGNLSNLSGSISRLFSDTASDTKRALDAFSKEYDADSIDPQGDALFNTMDNWSKSRWWSRFMKYGFGQETARFLVRAERLTDALAAGISTDIGIGLSKTTGGTGPADGGDEGAAIRDVYTPVKMGIDYAAALLGDMPAGTRFLAGQISPEFAAAAGARQALAEVKSTADGILAWSRANKEPPTGLSPVVDALKGGQAVQDAEQLKDAMRNALNVKTMDREGGPDLVNDFVKIHGDIDVNIPVEKIREIYGDKIPELGDNILGDVVEGLAQKMADAEEDAGDVTIPLSDWMTKVAPEVRTAIGDENLRLRPNGKTVEEAKAALPIDSVPPELPDQVRQIAGADPAFSPGQANKLILQKIDEIPANITERIGQPIQHVFSILNDRGAEVGHLIGTVSHDAKTLTIDQLAKDHFTPKNIMELIKGIHEQFPEVREVIGPDGKKIDLSTAKWNVEGYPQGWEHADGFDNFIHPDWWQKTSTAVEVAIKPTELWTDMEKETYEMMDRELKRILGGQRYVSWQQAQAIRMQGHVAGGVAQFFNERLPLLFWSLENLGMAPLRTVRHESIHILRNMGLFRPEEWRILETAAEAGNWIDKHSIRERYTQLGLGHEAMLEEAICEEFAFWKAGRKVDANTSLHNIFMKIRETLEAVGKGWLELMASRGKPPNWQELFTAIDIGEIGAREPKPRPGYAPEVFRPVEEARAQLPAEKPPEETRLPGRPFVKKAPGMSQDTYNRYVQAIENQWLNEREVNEERLRRKEARRQSREWRDNRKEMRQEVADRIGERPDVAAESFFREGKLHGLQVTTRPKLRADLVPPEYREILKPYLSKLGLAPDDVAGLFGYGTGRQMLDRMAGLMDMRNSTGLEPKDFMKRVVDQETDRMMELKYGRMEDEIDANVEAMLSKHTTDYLHEETLHYAEQAGMQTPLDPVVLGARAKMSVRRMARKQITYQNFMESAKRAADRVEKAALKEEWDEAFKYAQQREYAIAKAKEAREFEKLGKEFDRTAKVNAKRSRPKVIDQGYLNWVHQIYTQIGKPVRRTLQDIEKELESRDLPTAWGPDLKDFVNGESLNGQEISVPDYLYGKRLPDGSVKAWRKQYDHMTGQEFLDIKDTIDSLLQGGRNVMHVLSKHDEAALEDAQREAEGTIKGLGNLNLDAKGNPIQIGAGMRRFGRFALAYHIKVEKLIQRLEQGKHGVMTQVVRELIDAVDRRDLKSRQIADRMMKLPSPQNIRDKIDNPLFKRPRETPRDEPGALLPFTRRNLIGIMLNTGNEENLIKLATGYELNPQTIMDWVHAHATKEDWDFVQGMWDIFADLKGESDSMYRRISGIAPKDIGIRPVATKFGEYTGGYYPLIAHETWQGTGIKAPKQKLAMMNEQFVKATPPSGYIKNRTGAVYPLSLDLDAMPSRLNQEIHDIYVREAWMDANKLLGSGEMYNLISNHYGKEYAGLIEPWLRDVGNIAAYESELQRAATSWTGFLSQNVVNSLIGLNVNTIGKHGFTALGQSMYQVGAKDFWQAFGSLMSKRDTGEKELAFALKTSVELQRRFRNFKTITGAVDLKTGETGAWSTAREWSAHIGTAPVAFFDMMSAVPTWLARYKQVIREFPGDEEKAISEANFAVREAHGSTAITSKAAVQRKFGENILPLYNFFSHILNKQYEMMWRASDAVGYGRAGDTAAARAEWNKASGLFFWYTMFPAAVEMAFAGETVNLLSDRKRRENAWEWGKGYLKSYMVNLSSSWFVLRDLVSAVESGRDPSLGILGTEYRTVMNTVRDLELGPKMFDKNHAGRTLRTGVDAFSQARGVGWAELGKIGQYALDVRNGVVHPKGLWDWVNAYRYGTPPRGHR